jgi:hypothetical protein
MKRKKIPRKAVERLMKHCEWLSKGSERTAAEIFREYLELMRKYADYFFRDPWPEKYDFKAATTFAEADIEFLTYGKEGEYAERFKTLLLKKNINLATGFVELIGPFWTWQAFHDEFIRPTYAPVQEVFDALSEADHDPRSVLATLKAQFEIELIHDSLVDLAEHRYLEKSVDRLLAGLLELLHAEEGLPPCHDNRCESQRKSLHSKNDFDDDV